MHSGESDFDPPRFKPNPSVYLKAAETEGKEPVNCIAVEDSGSGVGSASNAGVGECPIPSIPPGATSTGKCLGLVTALLRGRHVL